MRFSSVLWNLASRFSGIPVKQLRCKHPLFARDSRLKLLPEEEGMDFYEECTLCGKEFR